MNVFQKFILGLWSLKILNNCDELDNNTQNGYSFKIIAEVEIFQKLIFGNNTWNNSYSCKIKVKKSETSA